MFKYLRNTVSYTKFKRILIQRKNLLVLLLSFCFVFYNILCLYELAMQTEEEWQLSFGIVPGWPKFLNRNVNIYIQPNKVTTIHNPKNTCSVHNRQGKYIFLIIFVTSAPQYFDKRSAIRDTWGNYKKYNKMDEVFKKANKKYVDYNYEYYDIYSEDTLHDKDINSYGLALHDLSESESYKKMHESNTNNDANREISKRTNRNKEIDEKNKSKAKQNTNTVNEILHSNYKKEDKKEHDRLEIILHTSKINKDDAVTEYRVIFLLGLPRKNITRIQIEVDKESSIYGDILQEDFVDYYNNLTFKSIMMLKWITNNCKDNVPYFLKTDDDAYVNVPKLISNLKNRRKKDKDHKYLLFGDLICNVKPVSIPQEKWYCSEYMYAGEVYPCFLTGSGYAFSSATAKSLYVAALNTKYFHLEDVFMTGICALKSKPPVIPSDDPSFTYRPVYGNYPCYMHRYIVSHRVTPSVMRLVHRYLAIQEVVDICERMRLMNFKRQRLRDNSPGYNYETTVGQMRVIL